jgi:hypothetical protein
LGVGGQHTHDSHIILNFEELGSTPFQRKPRKTDSTDIYGFQLKKFISPDLKFDGCQRVNKNIEKILG